MIMRKKIQMFFLFIVASSGFSQQWDWAVTADSVYGNQATRMICRNNTAVFALIGQEGPSVIGGTYLDSGCVVVRTSAAGQITWAKWLPGNIRGIYAQNNGDSYFIGNFKGTVSFGTTTLVAGGGSDILYGKLDGSGNVLWIKSGGSLNDDVGNCIRSDAQGNIFLGGQIKDDFMIDNQSTSGYTGANTYLIRCDQYGNYLESVEDSVGILHNALKFDVDLNDVIFMSCQYSTYPCPYYCSGNDILRVDPQTYTVTPQSALGSYEYLHSWAVNDDQTLTANYSTGSHYMTTYGIFRVVGNTYPHTFRKGLGNGYDGRWTPCLTKGIGKEIILGGDFSRGWSSNIDTIWYDSFFAEADTLNNIMVGAIDTSNLFTWLLRSKGKGYSHTSNLLSDRLGHFYVAGTYNTNYYTMYDTMPNPITFGNIVLSAENIFTRFFIAGGTTGAAISVNSFEEPLAIIFPNPCTGKLYCTSTIEAGNCQIFDLTGQPVAARISGKEIDLSAQPDGIYFVKITANKKRIVKKLILSKE